MTEQAQAMLFELPPAAPALVLDLEAVEEVKRAGVVAIDCETETRAPDGHPLGEGFGLTYCTSVTMVSFAWAGADGVRTLVMDGAWGETAELVKHLFSETPMSVFHNAVFDIRMLSKMTGGAWPQNGVWDTQVMAPLFKPELVRPSLLAVADAWGCAYPAWMREMKGKRSALHMVAADEVAEYAGWDARLTFAVYQAQAVLIEDERLFTLADWECRAVREYGRMAAEGVRVYQGALTSKLSEWKDAYPLARKALQKDGLHNPDSSAQVVKYIYGQKGIPRPEFVQGSKLFTKTGGLSGGKDAIQELVDMYPEHAETLKLLTRYAQLDSAIEAAEAVRDHAFAPGGDGRVHSLINIVTHTGRRASSQPNIQNLKMRPDDAHNMCGVLAGDGPDYTLFELDYSNAENWMAALIAGDDALAAACSAADFHSEMAKVYWPEQWAEAEARGDKAALKALRSAGKILTFGMAYGMGAGSLAVGLKMTKGEANTLLEKKDRAFPDVATAKRVATAKANSAGHVTLWTGRKVALSESTYRAWNYVCQGGVGELIKRSLVLIGETYRERGMKSRVAHDMHDALILSVYRPEWDEALEIAESIMTSVMPESLNQRTTPPIKWIAETNHKAQEENRAKWGKYQWHPELPAKTEQKPEPKPELVPAQTRVVTLEYPIMGDPCGAWRTTIEQTLQPDGAWRATPAQGAAFLQKVLARGRAWLAAGLEELLPNGQTAKVDRANWVKVAGLWARAMGEAGKPDEAEDWARIYQARADEVGQVVGLLEWLTAQLAQETGGK